MDKDLRDSGTLKTFSEEIKDIISEARSEMLTDPTKTILYAKTALITAQAKGMYEDELDCLLILAEAHKELLQFKEALEMVTKAENFAESHNQKRKAEVCMLNGEIHQADNQLDKALELYLRAHDFIKETGQDPQYFGSLLLKIASIYFAREDLKTTKEYYTQLLSWSEKHANQSLIASTLINLGNLYNKSAAYDLALDYFLRSLAIYTELKHLDGMVYNQINLGLLYWRRYQYDRALEYLKEAHDNVLKTVDKDLMFEVLNNLGMIYRNLKKFEEAKNCYDEAMKIKTRKSELPNIIGGNKLIVTLGERLNSLLNLITVYMKLDAKEATTEAVNEAITLLDKVDNKELIRETYKVLSDYYHHVNNYKEAYDHYKKYIKLSEEIHAEKETLKFANVERNHELQKMKEKTENRLKIAKTSAALAMAITASHEVNQPLMIIVGNLELLQDSLKDKDVSDKQKSYMQNIKLGVERVSKILEKFQNSKDIQFQDYSKSNEMVVYEEDLKKYPD